MNEIVKILIFSVSAFVVLFVISKLLGKKQLAELDFIDYVCGISIGSIAAEMATALDEEYWTFILAMFVFFVLDYLISILGIRCNKIKKFLKGTPILIISNGQLNYKAMKKCKVDINDVLGLARVQGYFSLEDIAYAIFETNGELSIIPQPDKRQTVLKDLNPNVTGKAALILNVIVDGTISAFALKQLNKSKDWLYAKLDIKNKKELKNFLLASYNTQTQKFFVQKKNP